MTGREAINIAIGVLEDQKNAIDREIFRLNRILEDLIQAETPQPNRRNRGATGCIRHRLKQHGPQSTESLARYLQEIGLTIDANRVYLIARNARDIKIKNNVCSIRPNVKVRPYLHATTR